MLGKVACITASKTALSAAAATVSRMLDETKYPTSEQSSIRVKTLDLPPYLSGQESDI